MLPSGISEKEKLYASIDIKIFFFMKDAWCASKFDDMLKSVQKKADKITNKLMLIYEVES